MRRAEAALGAGLLALAGCSLAPDYQAPSVATPAAYKEIPAGWQVAATGVSPVPAAWWTGFGDPVLDDLEGRIEAANPSLAAAVARYDQALGQLGVSRADLFPTATIGGSAERDRASEHAPTATAGRAFNDYTLSGSLSYELDLFGRIRNQIKASRSEVQASDADLRGVRLGLQAQVASTYFQLRGADSRLQLLTDTVRAYQRAYDLTVARHTGGVASGLDTSRARTQLSSARAEIAATRSQRQSLEHALAALVGVAPAQFSVAPRQGELPSPIAPPATLPSALLEHRPDIVAAERRTYAANRQIGVARAALYPSLTLGATGGFETTGPNFLSAASSFWALGPAAAAVTLLDGGARRSRVRVARGEFEEASANYKQTVLTAFREVEDDIAAAREQVQQENDLSDAAQAAQHTADLALVRYRDGASDYLEVVTAQTAALDSTRALIELKTQRLTTAVDFVRATGGPA